MAKDEQDSLIAKWAKYYQEKWHRTLLALTRYKNPSVANADNYSLMTASLVLVDTV